MHIENKLRKKSQLLVASIDKITAEGEILPKQEEENFKVGDTRGAIVTVENVAVSRGSAQILFDINLRIENRK